ncbi:hypothetical protein D7Z26_15435 [Cohnella endophytica]|uniref:Uncharacterized protein n=1 Tax=Cohnella endophytica TaxID=2419778 RepID=A0A494XR60_9BACL|nr:hypothetical protein D7Z26_15435 [Cohnella endophytica]
MSFQNPATQERVLYQADPNVVTTLRSIRDRVYHITSTHVNRRVRVQSLDGNTYEGVIVHVDSRHVYLMVPHPSVQRAFFGPSEAAILTLVLFELLVIVLLA